MVGHRNTCFIERILGSFVRRLRLTVVKLNFMAFVSLEVIKDRKRTYASLNICTRGISSNTFWLLELSSKIISYIHSDFEYSVMKHNFYISPTKYLFKC